MNSFRHSCMQIKQITTLKKVINKFLLIFRVEWQEMYALRVKLVDPNAKIPTKSSEGAAGLDLYAAHDFFNHKI
jgi:hypothetical protein